jgi:hypothetical protein
VLTTKSMKVHYLNALLQNTIKRYLISYVTFNVENVNLRGYKWNETVSDRICYVRNEICNSV